MYAIVQKNSEFRYFTPRKHMLRSRCSSRTYDYLVWVDMCNIATQQ